jgi:hypothetical protein
VRGAHQPEPGDGKRSFLDTLRAPNCVIFKKASSEKPAEFVLMVHQMPYGAIIEPKGRWSMVFSVSPSEHTKAKVYGQESVMGKMMALSRRLPLKMPEGKVLFKVAMTS